MKKYITVVLLVILSAFENEAYSTTPMYFGEKTFYSNNVKPKIDSNYKRTAELIKLINKVNEHNNMYEDKHKHGDYSNEEKQMAIDLDYYSLRKEVSGDLVSKIMKLIQKNYDTNREHEDNDGVRINIISNPDVLENYKKNLREASTSSSSDDSSDDSFSDRKLKEFIKALRRNAVFRLDARSSAENDLSAISHEDDIDDVKLQHSIEDNSNIVDKEDSVDQIQPQRNSTETIADGTDNQSTKDTKNDNQYRKRDGNNQEYDNQDNLDVITKKYEWDVNEERANGKRNKKDRESTNFEENEQDWNGNKKFKSGRYKDTDTTKKSKKKKRLSQENSENTGKPDKIHDWPDVKPKKGKNNWDTKASWKNKENDWDKITTKRNKVREDNAWQSYKPRKPVKAKRLDNWERSGSLPSFGRTPIPFVGKKGIYEDK